MSRRVSVLNPRFKHQTLRDEALQPGESHWASKAIVVHQGVRIHDGGEHGLPDRLMETSWSVESYVWFVDVRSLWVSLSQLKPSDL